MKTLIALLIVSTSLSASAEWYNVTKVLSYNTVEAQLSSGAGSKSTIVIRIKNLEKIEYITNDRTKALLGGDSPRAMLEQLTKGEKVWIDDLETINGENVGYLFPSYEQVLKVYMKHHIAGSYSISPAVKQKLISIHKKMLATLKSSSPPQPPKNDENNIAHYDVRFTKFYDNDYTKALFIFDGLNWFKKTGQFLPQAVQEVYVDWLSDYQSAGGTDARDAERKIIDMQRRNDLYRDFLF